MSLDLNDPRLTAYALNELDPRERESLEKELANDPAAQELVNDLCDTASFLTVELGAEPAPELASTQKEAIRNGHSDTPVDASVPTYADKNKIIPFPVVRWITWGCGIAAAAGLVIGLMFPFMQGAMSRKRDVARVDFESHFIAGGGTAVVTTAPVAVPSDPILEPAVPVQAPSPAKSKTEVFIAEAYSGAPVAQGNSYSVADLRAEPKVAARNRTRTSVDVVRELSDSNAAVTATPAPSASVALASVSDASKPMSADKAAPLSKQRLDYTFAGKDSKLDGLPLVGRLFQSKQAPTTAQPVAPNESYAPITENEFLNVTENPLSTFSIDVDTASYANVRRFLENGQRPPADAVRIEEMINYFPYAYATPTGDDPFAANVEIADCPWDRSHRLVRVGLKGREIARNERPASNLVFLIDVSGSMNEPAKLPLVKASLEMLVNRLNARDRIAIAVYAGNSGLVLPSTPATPDNKQRILGTLDRLQAGGSTNGGEGIQLAYAIARENFIKGGTNRVILCTDGDFNVGVTSQGALVDLIKQEAKSGVFLTLCGFGTENLKDSTMMNLADKGNGNYAYIDSLREGRKVFVEQMSGTLVTIAKDVKIQIEFNPARVASYRLVGYEKRMLAKEDFNNDKKDAGEIGAGHTVTALYEIVPTGKASKPAVDPLKYQSNTVPVPGVFDRDDRAVSPDLLTLKIRYKQPDGATSKKLEFPIRDSGAKLESASPDFKFAASVAAFGMILRDSSLKGDADYDLVLKLARAGKGDDEEGYRAEFIRLVKTAAEMGR